MTEALPSHGLKCITTVPHQRKVLGFQTAKDCHSVASSCEVFLKMGEDDVDYS